MNRQKIKHQIVLTLCVGVCVVFLCWPVQAATIASGQGLAGGDVVDSYYTMESHSSIGVLFRTRAAEYRLAIAERDFENSVVALALSQANRLPLYFATSGTSISKLSISGKQNDVPHTSKGTTAASPTEPITSIKTKITSFRSIAKGGIDVVCDSCPTDKQTAYHLSGEAENFELLVRKIAWAWKTQTPVILELRGLAIDGVLVQRE